MPHRLVPPDVPEPNVTQSPREPHVELLDLQTRDVWLCQEPLSEERYRALKPAAPLMKVGRGIATFDCAWFRRSPGAALDAPLEAMQVEGLRFVRVARPQALKSFAAGDLPTRLLVEKHHVVGFDAGTVLPVARLPDGQYYIQQTAAADGAGVDPREWVMHRMTLTRAWTVELPCPTTVWFFRNSRSFCGPFGPEQLPEPLQANAREAA